MKAKSQADRIATSYNSVADSYDNLLTSPSLLSRLYNKVVWNLQDSDYVPKLLSLFPKIENAVILDIPVGTGVFTVDLYRSLDRTNTIITADYSEGMLEKAKERYRAAGLTNITCVRADIGHLPYDDNSIDILLTMNGFHAFPDKEKALGEMARVLKPGGTLLGCFYIRGERSFTDFLINTMYSRQGAFTPPFYSLQEVKQIWSCYFDFDAFENEKSILYFSGKRKG